MWTEHLIPASLFPVPLGRQLVGVLVCVLQGRKLELPVAGWPAQPPHVMPPPSVQALAGGLPSEFCSKDSAGLRLGSHQFL